MTKGTRRMSLAALLAAAIAGPSAAWAHDAAAEYHYETGGTCDDCVGSPPFHFDPYYSAHGWTYRYAAIQSGTGGAVYQCHQLRVNGVTVNAASYTARGDNRGFSTQEYAVGNIRAIRDIYVPEDGLDFIRYVDNIRNAGAGAAVVTISYYCTYYGCSGADCTMASSDGDETTEAGDYWYAWEGGSYATVGALMYADGADEEVTSVSFSGWNAYTINFSLDIPAGQTQKLLTFITQSNDADEGGALLDYLSVLPPEATVDWDVALPDFVNFVTDGRPAVSPGGPYSIPEGGEIVMEPRVFDREDDPLLWSWDLDGDGGFDDSADLNAVLNPDVRPEIADGDAEFSVSLYVVEDIDDGKEVIRDADIEVINVAPIVVSEPPIEARRGGEYRYTPAISDPAGALDTYTVECVEDECPPAMGVTDSNGDGSPDTLTWTPVQSDLESNPHHVHFTVSDEDDGVFEQEFDVTVRDNTEPFEPALLYPTADNCVLIAQPTLKIANATDLDDDPLTYYAEIDSDPQFRSPAHQESGPMEEGIGGFTEWRVPAPLFDGEGYFWRAWVTDGIEESEKVTQFFEVCLEGGPDGDVDADTDTDTDTDTDSFTLGGDGGGESGSNVGCACRTTNANGEGAALFLLAAGALLVNRRRRSS